MAEYEPLYEACYPVGLDGCYEPRFPTAVLPEAPPILLEPRRVLGASEERAIKAGLQWLARHQSLDGHWSAADFGRQCTEGHCEARGLPDYDCAVSALALLAFLEAGYTPACRATYIDPVNGKTVRPGRVVREGLRFLIDAHDAEGRDGHPNGAVILNRAIAAYALSRAYAFTSAVVYRGSAERAIGALVAAQLRDPTGRVKLGWGLAPSAGPANACVTGWCLLALEAARRAGLDVPQSSFVGARTWIVSVTEIDGRLHGQTGDTIVGSGADDSLAHPTGTAVGLATRMLVDLGKKDDPVTAHAARVLAGDLPSAVTERSARNPIDFQYWFWGTQALARHDAPGGPLYREWNKAQVDALCQSQCTKKDGCASGSWPTERDRWASWGGRVYATALNVLTLETPPPDLKRRASRW